MSQITITFVQAREIDGAANDVRDRVARIRKNLPAASDNSMVSKIEADAQPIMWIALTSDRYSPMEMTDYADRYLTDPLKALPGVASVIIGGERKYAMRVWLDRERLAAQGLTARTSKMRSTGRTSILPAAGSKARSANSACRRAPICARRKNSTT